MVYMSRYPLIAGSNRAPQCWGDSWRSAKQWLYCKLSRCGLLPAGLPQCQGHHSRLHPAASVLVARLCCLACLLMSDLLHLVGVQVDDATALNSKEVQRRTRPTTNNAYRLRKGEHRRQLRQVPFIHLVGKGTPATDEAVVGAGGWTLESRRCQKIGKHTE